MISAQKKIVSLEEALSIRAQAKAVGKRVAALSGSFDLMHGGHIAILEESRDQGDMLFVLLNSDASVSGYKGPGRPFVPEKDRALLLAGVSAVDYVIVFNDLVPIKILEALQPDVYCNGSDWGEGCIETPTVEAYGGKMYFISRGAVSTASSTEIVKRICAQCGVAPIKAAFIDRDGVVLEDVGYLHEVEKAKFLPNAIQGIKKIADAGYTIIIVTNQSGIGRGKYPESDMHTVNDWMVGELKKNGVAVAGVYFCPHAPEDACECRKPKTELLTRAARDHNLTLEKCWVIGDKASDIECGRYVNAKAILIDSGQYPYESKVLPHHKAKDLLESADFLSK